MNEDCTAKVPLMISLADANRSDLHGRVNAIEYDEEDCKEEEAFARRFGMEAFIEHRRLIDRVLEAFTCKRRHHSPGDGGSPFSISGGDSDLYPFWQMESA